MTSLSHWERDAMVHVLRRAPRQARSWKNVEHIVAAAETMLQVRPSEDVVRAVAEICDLANVPMGSFYTYFDNVEGVLEAIRHLWAARFAPMTEAAFSHTPATWQDVVECAMAAVLEFYSHAVTRELWLHHQLTPAAAEAERSADAALGRRMVGEWERLGFSFIGTAPDSEMISTVMDQLIRLAIRVGGDSPDTEYLATARRATRAVVGTLLVPANLAPR